MKLKTSFFNPAVLKKDITRYAPVWGLYTIFMLLFLLLLRDAEVRPASFAYDAPEVMLCMGVVNFFYAGICALILFGDLFKSRMCNALHAMPMRREGWFLTHATAGMLFCVVPNTVGALVAALMLQQYCYLAFLWLAVMVLQFLFFFGVGVFACLCAGNHLGAATVYGMINFLAVLVTWLVITFIEPVLYGIRLDAQQYFKFSPVVAFSSYNYVQMELDAGRAKFVGFYPEQWGYLGVAAGVGILLMGLAVLLYRKRKLENAGELISVEPVRPVFLVLLSLCAGAVFYLAAEIFSGEMEYVFLVIGLAVGYFVGKMLLEKKVRVFGGRNLLQFAVLLIALAACIITARMDPVGITRYVPSAQQVKSVKIGPYSSAYYSRNSGYVLTEAEDLEMITQIHQQLVDTGYDTGDMFLQLEYAMKNGTVVKRQYSIAPGSKEGQLLKHYYSSAPWVFGTEDLESLLKRATMIEVVAYSKDIPSILVHGTQYDAVGRFEEKWGDTGEVRTYHASSTFDKEPVVIGLVDAMRKDCAEGNMAQNWDYHQDDETVGYIVIQYFNGEFSYQESVDITIFSNCQYTMEYLRFLLDK